MPGISLRAVAALLAAALPAAAQLESLLQIFADQFTRNMRSVPAAAGQEARLPLVLPDSGVTPARVFLSVPLAASGWWLMTPEGARVDSSNAQARGYGWEAAPNADSETLPEPLRGGSLWIITLPMEAKGGTYVFVAKGGPGNLAATYLSPHPPGVPVEVVGGDVRTGDRTYFTGDTVEFAVSAPEVRGAVQGVIHLPSRSSVNVAFKGPDAAGMHRTEFIPRQAGSHAIYVTIPGRKRREMKTFPIFRRGVHFRGFTETPVDADGDKLTDSVRFTLRFEAVRAARYSLVVRLRPRTGAPIENRQVAEWSAGPKTVSFDVTAQELLERKNDGPLQIEVIHITDTSPSIEPSSELAGTWDHAGSTRAYPRASLDRGDYYFSDDAAFSAVDSNRDGLIDTLRLETPAMLPGGPCQFSARLFSNGSEVASLDHFAQLHRGRNVLTFDFNGSAIRRKSKPGVLVAVGIRAFCGGVEIKHRDGVNSRSYRPEQFELVPEGIGLTVPAVVSPQEKGYIFVPVLVSAAGGFDGIVRLQLNGLPQDFRQPPATLARAGEDSGFHLRVPPHNPGGRWQLELIAEAEDSPLRAAASIHLEVPARDIEAVQAYEAAVRKEIGDAFALARPSPEAPPKNLVLLVDRSGSLSMAMACTPLREAVRAFTKTLRQGHDALSVVLFSSAVLVETPLTRQFTPGDAFRDTQPCSGNSNTSAALQQAVRELTERGVPGAENHIVVFTDGAPTVPTLFGSKKNASNQDTVAEQMKRTLAEALAARGNPALRARIHVIAMAAPPDVQAWYASLANGHYLLIQRPEDIELTFAKLAQLLAASPNPRE